MPNRFFPEESEVIRSLPRTRRILTIPAALGLALALVAFTHPGGLATAYDDLQDYDGHRQQLETMRIDSHRLDADLVNLTDRIALKGQWIEELVEGRATLKTTTQRFMELNRSNDRSRQIIEDHGRGATYEEKAARNVVDYLRLRLRMGPMPSDTPQRIRGEFQAWFGTTVDVG